MPSKKSLKIALIVLVILFAIALLLPFLALAGQPLTNFSMILSSINWPIFIVLFALIAVVLTLYLKAKE